MADTPENADGLRISANPPVGSTMESQYVKYVVRVYAVPEPIAEQLTSLNDQANIFFTLSMLFASIPIGIGINWLFLDSQNASITKPAILLAVVGGVAFFAFIIAAFNARRANSKVWAGIKTNSQSA